VERYHDHLRDKGYGDSSIKKYLTALSTLYRWGISQELAEREER
jgi:site-specific recombinase XerD